MPRNQSSSRRCAVQIPWRTSTPIPFYPWGWLVFPFFFSCLWIEFHFPIGWMNDPNGPFYDPKTSLYHLMYVWCTVSLHSRNFYCRYQANINGTCEQNPWGRGVNQCWGQKWSGMRWGQLLSCKMMYSPNAEWKSGLVLTHRPCSIEGSLGMDPSSSCH
jgi:hypothetical protein